MKISVPMYRALCYASVFRFPLTEEEMKRYAIRHGPHVSLDDIVRRVVYRREYYCLKGNEKDIDRRIRNLPYVDAKMRHAHFAARLFALVPTVLGVFITGGLAVGNVQKDDDIDFLIVTKQGWVWTTRFMLVVMSKLIGKYTHKRERREDATFADANTWCLNMWLDETALAVPLTQRNVYTAHEVIQALPLVNREKIAERFLWANRWAGGWVKIKSDAKFIDVKKTSITMIEKVFYAMQTYRMTKRQSIYSAIFHPGDTGGEVNKIYFRSLI